MNKLIEVEYLCINSFVCNLSLRVFTKSGKREFKIKKYFWNCLDVHHNSIRITDIKFHYVFK